MALDTLRFPLDAPIPRGDFIQDGSTWALKTLALLPAVKRRKDTIQKLATLLLLTSHWPKSNYMVHPALRWVGNRIFFPGLKLKELLCKRGGRWILDQLAISITLNLSHILSSHEDFLGGELFS